MRLPNSIVRVAKADMKLLELLSQRGSFSIEHSKTSVQRQADRFVQKGWALLADRTLHCTPLGFHAAMSAKVQGLRKKQG